MLHHHIPLDLQGRGQFALFLGEIAVENMELLDGLRVRHRAVGVVNGVLDLCPQHRIGVQLAVAHIVINTVVALPLLQGDLVERDEAPDERLTIADEHHLAYQRVRACDLPTGQATHSCRPQSPAIPSSGR